MEILCKVKTCTGHYIVRDGKFGVFAGCSEFPKCKSSMKIPELVENFIKEKGIKIYCWGKICWKCSKTTPVISYFLNYELEELDSYLGMLGPIGLADLESVDRLLEQVIPSIKECYSYTTKSTYIANTCEHCGSLQGRNYVVDDPHEIITDLWHNHDMEKYLYGVLSVEEVGDLSHDLRRIYS
ncbi:topoisomerase DNA-binding C4 zinc finger domain-containing protein [Listeria booriae]|uniref:topoisomerase DNA-binding C4 zinc finger domain-containing protein n=1 Tax=Listeria booriae TaxID=1552123 RepID=UPI00162A9DD8|nr:topoisomerase DNA-binding C4 zinc finger domain-containing protein [Listeria booriae]MBC1802176.1 hypothetical protein [Listeria booriae]